MSIQRSDILLPCQYCGKLETRAATSVHRAATCFSCRASRIRKAARAHLYASRSRTISDDNATSSLGKDQRRSRANTIANPDKP